MRARHEAIERLAPQAAAEFGQLAGYGLLVRYLPNVLAAADLDGAFRAALAERRGDELQRRTSLVGPHRDDLELAVRDLGARAPAPTARPGRRRCACGSASRRPSPTRSVSPRSCSSTIRSARSTPRVATASLDRLAARGGQVVISVADEADVPPGAAAVWDVRAGGVDAEGGGVPDVRTRTTGLVPHSKGFARSAPAAVRRRRVARRRRRRADARGGLRAAACRSRRWPRGGPSSSANGSRTRPRRCPGGGVLTVEASDGPWGAQAKFLHEEIRRKADEALGGVVTRCDRGGRAVVKRNRRSQGRISWPRPRSNVTLRRVKWTGSCDTPRTPARTPHAVGFGVRPRPGGRLATAASPNGGQMATRDQEEDGRRTTPATSRSSRGSNRSASARACTSAPPAPAGCITSSTRSSTTRSTRRWRGSPTRSSSRSTPTARSASSTTAAASRSSRSPARRTGVRRSRSSSPSCTPAASSAAAATRSRAACTASASRS